MQITDPAMVDCLSHRNDSGAVSDPQSAFPESQEAPAMDSQFLLKPELVDVIRPTGFEIFHG